MGSPFCDDFPLLKKFSTGNGEDSSPKPFIYLDNAATTQKPEVVLNAVEVYYREWNANPYRGLYRRSKIATELYEGSREYLARFFGTAPSEIIFTRNTTEAINLVANSYGLTHVNEGDRVVISVAEHHSNLVVWQQICAKRGAELVYMYPSEKGVVTTEEIQRAITENTKIVALTYVSNVLGSINPVEEVIEYAHKMGAVVLLDCAQVVAHIPLNFKKLGVDFAAFSGHKVYAPMGIGVLFAKQEHLDQMEPFLFGGEMIDEVTEQSSTFEKSPKKFEAGTPNVGGAIGLAQALQYLEVVGFDTIQERESQLTRRLLEGMATIDDLTIYGNPEYDENRCGVVSFSVAITLPNDIAAICDIENIAIRSGSHCAQPLHKWLGVADTCRVSPCFYNSEEEIDAFLEVITGVKRKIAKRIMTLFP